MTGGLSQAYMGGIGDDDPNEATLAVELTGNSQETHMMDGDVR